MYKELFSLLAIALTWAAFLPYIRSIRRDETKPHVVSWVIWGATTLIVFLAQLADRGGAGAWPIGVSGVITLYVALLAYMQKSDTMITKADWMYLILAMSSLPLWYFSADPLWAVVILTWVDVLGFAPTFMKAYARPFEEQLTFYILIALRNMISIMALKHYSLTTVLFPAVLALACLILILMVMYRRRKLMV